MTTEYEGFCEEWQEKVLDDLTRLDDLIELAWENKRANEDAQAALVRSEKLREAAVVRENNAIGEMKIAREALHRMERMTGKSKRDTEIAGADALLEELACMTDDPTVHLIYQAPDDDFRQEYTIESCGIKVTSDSLTLAVNQFDQLAR